MIALNNIGFKTKHKGLQNLITKMVKQKVNKTYQMIWLGKPILNGNKRILNNLNQEQGEKLI